MATSDGDVSFFCDFFDMTVELIGEQAHDAVCKLFEPQGPEQLDHSSREKEAADIGPEDDPIKAEVAELDIWIELVEKGVVHGCSPFFGFVCGNQTQ